MEPQRPTQAAHHSFTTMFIHRDLKDTVHIFVWQDAIHHSLDPPLMARTKSLPATIPDCHAWQASAGTEIQVQGQTSSPAGRLVGTDYSIYRIPVTHARLEEKSQRSCCMCADRSKCQTRKTVKKCTTMYCCKWDVVPCIVQCFEVYHTKPN
jgi:hypothetical protein